MSHNPVTGIRITTPKDWVFRHSESWAVRIAKPPGEGRSTLDTELSNMPRTLLLNSSHPYIDILEEPGHHYSPVHYHTEPEVMVVLCGRMILNGEWCEPGTVIYIPAHEEYWHATHEEPCLVAVIRPGERGLLVHGTDTRAAKSNTAEAG
jgi:hypothetical protein